MTKKRAAKPVTAPAPVNRTLLYFPFEDSLHFIEPDQAREFSAMWQTKTWREFEQRCPQTFRSALVRFAGEAGYEEDEFDDAAVADGSVRDEIGVPGPDESFHPGDVPGASDGDWPDFPPTSMFTTMPASVIKAFGRQKTTTLNGEALSFAVEDESRIVEALKQFGIRCERDESLADIYG